MKNTKTLSQRKIIAGYNDVVIKYAIGTGIGKNKVYECNNDVCDNKVMVELVHNGNPQDTLTCLKCRTGMMVGSLDHPKDMEPTMEYYRPDCNFLVKNKRNSNLVNWILEGGLILRAKHIPREKNPLEIAVEVLQSLEYKRMPSPARFYKEFTEELKIKLNIEEDGK